MKTTTFDFTTLAQAKQAAARFSRLGYSVSQPWESHDHFWCITVVGM